MRSKLPTEKKKKKFSLSIDGDLLKIFDKYTEENNIKNKSKYIENLIIPDLILRGEDIKKEF